MRVGRNAQGVRYGELLAGGAGEAIEPESRRDTDSARTPHPSRGFAAPRHHPEGGGSCAAGASRKFRALFAAQTRDRILYLRPSLRLDESKGL